MVMPSEEQNTVTQFRKDINNDGELHAPEPRETVQRYFLPVTQEIISIQGGATSGQAAV